MTTVAFHTLGCKSNQYETDLMRDICALSGFDIIPFDEKADIYVINTCTVTGNADRKSRAAIRSAKKKNKDAVVITTGCFIESGRNAFFDIDGIDVILRNKDKRNILNFLPKIEGRPGKIDRMVRANLMIENGCENFCSYCIVPLVRGKIARKPVDRVIEEASEMVKDGVKEIVLTGINLGEYGPASLPSLIKKLADIDGLLRIRISSIEPMYVNDDLIKVVKDTPKVCKHFHIPLQSGDDQILSSMNRKYTSGDFESLIKKIRSRIIGVGITTDVIVGFPGEDEKAFNNTCKVVDRIKFSRIHVFSYSDRPGTAAFSFKNKVDPSVIRQRYDKMLDLRAKYMLDFQRSFRNKPMEVLIERKDPATGLYEGLTTNYIRVFVPGDDIGDDSIGKLVSFKFRDFRGEHVFASPVLL